MFGYSATYDPRDERSIKAYDRYVRRIRGIYKALTKGMTWEQRQDLIDLNVHIGFDIVGIINRDRPYGPDVTFNEFKGEPAIDELNRLGMNIVNRGGHWFLD